MVEFGPVHARRPRWWAGPRWLVGLELRSFGCLEELRGGRVAVGVEEVARQAGGPALGEGADVSAHGDAG